ncbi:hypothetical protein LPJ75_001230 [Coemansia sp. RSA 2598]|nr:hypothetical protein LPJ75_001230 [Coemansia sp. RSA 2598]
MNVEQIQEYVNNAICKAMQHATITAHPDVQMDATLSSDSEDETLQHNQELNEESYKLIDAAYDLSNAEVCQLHSTIPKYQHPCFQSIKT